MKSIETRPENRKQTRNATLAPIYGGASGRKFLRLTLGPPGHTPPTSLVAMVVPVTEIDSFDAYCANADYLRNERIPVPSIPAAWRDHGIALLEDFGDITLTRAFTESPDRRREYFEAAIALLVRLHACRPNPAHPCPAFSLHFDVDKWMYEYRFHVREWLVSRHWGIIPARHESRLLDKAFSWLARTLSKQPRVFTHRDYQSSNLILRVDGSLGLIDFQDARQGLRQYDLASLLYDSYVALAQNERADYSGLYRESAGLPMSKDEHESLLRIAAIQRKLHDAGAFAYASHGRGKTEFLRYIPDAISQATTLMDEVPQLRETGRIFADFGSHAEKENRG